MKDMDGSPEPGFSSLFQRRRVLRLVGLACLAALAFFAWELVPAWLSLFWTSVPYAIRRTTAIAFLDVLLVSYVVVLAAVILGMLIGGVVVARSRGAFLRRPRLARLLLLNLSLLLSVALLEASAAVWRGWLHRSPILLKSQPRPVDPSQNLPTKFQSPEGGTACEPLRILVIGESSGRGEPYHPWLSVGQIVGWQLERVFPGRPIEVDMWAAGGATLELMHQKLARLTYRPDVLLVFSGHNEFQGRYSWSRNPPYYYDEQDHKAVTSPVDLVLRSSPICRLILETLDWQSVDLIPQPVITRQLVDRPTCTEGERAAMLADFKHRVESITAFCESIGTLPICIIPASNDGDYEPSRSVLPSSADRNVREAFARAFLRAREQEKSDTTQAVAAYRALLAAGPGFAESHYRLARLLERAGAWDEARSHYIQAREDDAMPMRCPEAFRRAYRDVAARHSGLILVDSTRVFEPLSPHRILDDHLFHDAQHPTLRGYIALAQDVLNQLHDRHALGWSAGAPAPVIDPAECARHFQLEQKRWAEVCERSASFYEVTAFIRHDPTERKDREMAYKKAAQFIASGKPPEQAGITGLGVHPAPAP